MFFFIKSVSYVIILQMEVNFKPNPFSLQCCFSIYDFHSSWWFAANSVFLWMVFSPIYQKIKHNCIRSFFSNSTTENNTGLCHALNCLTELVGYLYYHIDGVVLFSPILVTCYTHQLGPGYQSHQSPHIYDDLSRAKPYLVVAHRIVINPFGALL